MLKLKQHPLWRWSSLAVVIILLALCLILLGSLVASAQGPSPDQIEVLRGNSPPASYPWEQATVNTRSLLSPQADEFDLVVGTWAWPGYARPGGVFVYGIYYRNDSNATIPAENVAITDTLPLGTVYAGDTSGLPHIVGPGGEIIWDLGTLDPGDWDVFMVTVGVPPETPVSPGNIPPNQAVIGTTSIGDWDPGNNADSSEPVDVDTGDVEVQVNKGPEPGDPTPGQEFQYVVSWCNNRGSAVGPVTLVDTLPAGTHFVRWEHNPRPQKFWLEISASDNQLVLEAPGLPGGFCQDLNVVLDVDPAVPVSTTLANLVVINAADDVDPENDGHLNDDAHVSPPRADLAVDKWFNSGVLVPGGWIGYGVSYHNQGNVAANVWLTDTLPGDTDYQPGSAQIYGEPFNPDIITPDSLEWDLGTVGVNQGADFTFNADIDASATPGMMTNCVTIGHDLDEETPGDNESCVELVIWPPGPNLHVAKESQWNYDHIQYRFFAANIGTVPIHNVVIVDTYPVGTAPEGEPNVPPHLQGKTLVSSAPSQWIVEIAELLPGESGWFDFSVSIVDPGVRPAEFVNLIEITGDLPDQDVNPADNVYQDQIVKGEVERVELWLAPDGQSSMWGEAVVGEVVTVTTQSAGFTTTAEMDECPVCWEIQDTGVVIPGEVITVESAGGLMPVVFQVPDPFTAVLDREAATVSGQIDHLDTEPIEVRGWWEGGEAALTTNASGVYTATYDAIPPGAEGVTYYETTVNYAEVTYRRHFRDMSLLLQVNYDHDWIQGEYEIGHTVWLTVTKPTQTYTTELTTEYMEGWEDGGFTTDWAEWSPEQPNLEPGDLVSGTVDTGYTAVLTIGQITGWVDADNDRIDGEVDAEWLSDPIVDVECHPWGGPEDVPSKWSTAGIEGDPPYACDWSGEWDVQPGQDIAVAYHEPEGHQVYGVFSAPWMRVNYGHDWVGGNYPLSHTFVISVTESDGITVKGVTEEVEVTPDGGWGGSGFETQEDSWLGGSPPDIMPGDLVHFYTDGYENTVQVGEIGGVVDVENDRVGGPIFAEWFIVEPEVELDVECHPWGNPDGGDPKSSTAGPDGHPEYLCDWSDEWNIVPGQDIGVMYIEPDDGDRVMTALWEPAPDMSVDKQVVGGDQFAPGGRAVFWIGYHNEGDADAYPATLVDTLPAGATYVEDTSGLAASYDEGAGTVEWDLGTVAPDDGGGFYLVVELPDPAPEDLTNVVEVSAVSDPNQDNDYAEATIHRTESDIELHIWKNPSPGDPTPGSTYVYDIEYANNGTVPSGQATLTDILPNIPGVCSTSVVDWYSQNGYDLWADISADNTELVLTAPSLPAGWSDRIILRLKVDDACPTETQTQLVNEVILSAPPADTVSHVNEDAWTSGPYTNAHLEKDFGWGILVPGGEIAYNLHVANHGNLTATISLTDTLPVGTSFVESWSWDGQEHLPLVPDHLDGAVSWDLGEIPPGAWLDIELRLDIAPTVAPNEVLTNCAEIVVAEGDVWPLDNTACQAEAVREDGPNLRIYKDYRWNSESQIQYDIQFQNVGTEPLLGVEIVDTLPEGTDFSGEPGEWGHDFWDELYYDPLGLTPRWIIPVLEPGWSSRIWFNANLDSGEQGMIYINLAAAEIEGDVWPDDNISEVTAYTGPDIFVEKWLSGGEVRPGEIVTFTVKVGNQNRWPWGTDPEPPDPPTEIVDTLPDELSFITATAPWNPDEEWLPDEIVGNTLTWGFGPMHSESWWTFQIVALVAEDAVEDDVIVNTVQAYSNSEHDVDPLPDNNAFELLITILPRNYYIYLPLILRNY